MPNTHLDDPVVVASPDRVTDPGGAAEQDHQLRDFGRHYVYTGQQ